MKTNIQQVYRQQIEVGKQFTAPEDITLGWQEDRKSFSIWYISGQEATCNYVVLGTGYEFIGLTKIISTVCVDGFHVFHLCKICELTRYER